MCRGSNATKNKNARMWPYRGSDPFKYTHQNLKIVKQFLEKLSTTMYFMAA